MEDNTTEDTTTDEQTTSTEALEQEASSSPPTFFLENVVRSRATRDLRRGLGKARATIIIGGGDIVVRRHRRKPVSYELLTRHQEEIADRIRKGQIRVYTSEGLNIVHPDKAPTPLARYSPLPQPLNDDIRNDPQVVGTRLTQGGNVAHDPTPESLGQRLPALLQPRPPEEAPEDSPPASDTQTGTSDSTEDTGTPDQTAQGDQGDQGQQTEEAPPAEASAGEPLTASIGEEQQYHEEHSPHNEPSPEDTSGGKKKKRKGASK